VCRTILKAFAQILTLWSMAAIQTNAQYVTDANNNLPPFGAFSGSDLDTITLQNGNLHISIPLLESSQRGKPIWYHLVFDTPTFGIKSTTVNHTTSFSVIPDPVYTNWGLTSPFNWQMYSPDQGTAVNCGGTSSYTLSDYVLVDPERRKHALPLLKIQTFQGATGSCNPPSTLRAPDMDGMGVLVDISGTSTNGIYLNDGTFLSSSLEDPNGNMASLATDTLGRDLLITANGPTVTYTTPLGLTRSGPQYTTYTYKDSNGASQVWTANYEAIDLNTHFCDKLPRCADISKSLLVLAKLTLPTGAFYQFTYDNDIVGEITSITLPTGGVLSYSYQPDSAHVSSTCIALGGTSTSGCGARVFARTRLVGGVSQTWHYSMPGTVTDPYGNDEVHLMTDPSVSFPGHLVETGVQYWKGSSTSGGTLLRQINFTYAWDQGPSGSYPGSVIPSNYRVIQQDTVLENGQTTRVQTDYTDSFTYSRFGTSYTSTRPNPTEIREYNYGSGAAGPLLRRTDRTYLHVNNSTYANLNIVDRPVSVIVHDGSGNIVSQTTYEYDVYNHTGLPSMGVSGAVQHDSARNTNYTTRGNVTGISRWLNTSSSWQTTNNQYDDAGNVIATKDPKGYITSFDYTDSWNNSTCAPSGGQGKAYVTTITNAISQISKKTYNSCTGSLASSKDQNDINAARPGTTHSYDMMGRTTQISYPDGGQTTNCYSDVGGSGCTQSGPPFNMITTRVATPDPSIVITTLFDGLGRPSVTQLNSDPDGVTYTAMTYDLLGRISQQYNPTRCNPPTTSCGESTWGYTTTNYDGLSRVTSVIAQDNGSTTTWAYTGNCVTVTDPASISRKSCSDALGRLTQVTEDPGSPPHFNYVTTYSYDALDNLLTVVQNGSRQRYFSYDSLSRLLCASNPENSTAACPNPASGTYTTGTTGYTYDANGNLSTRIAPAPNQVGSATVTTTYTYDALNRLTHKTYSDAGTSGATAPVAMGYDEATAWGPITNPIGRLTTAYAGTAYTPNATGAEYSYDAMGRAVLYAQCTPSNCGTSSFNTNYTYDLGGNMTAASDGFGITISYNHDSAGRVSQVTSSYVDAQHPATLATLDATAGYLPNGAIHKMTLGNNVTESSAYNSLLQACRIGFNTSASAYPTTSSACTSAAPAKNTLDLTYCYGLAFKSACSGTSSTASNNGDISNWNAAGNQIFTRSYSYDSLNRLGSSYSPSDSCTGYAWTYDPWGNLYDESPAPGATGTCFTYHGPQPSGKNQLVGTTGTTYQYDAAGNMAYDGYHHYYYDAENRLIQLDGTFGSCSAPSTFCYVYDANGTRVRTTAPNGASEWIKDLNGNTIAQSTDAYGFGRGYVYLGSQQIAEYGDGTTYFIHPDHLGSTRLVSKMDASIKDSYDYQSFGQVVTSVLGGNSVMHLFTGKEHDAESATGIGAQNGLDYFGARYYSSRIFRFMSPDPNNAGTSLNNPESWNAYSYVLNNPLIAVDPSGLDCVYLSNDHTSGTVVRGDCYRENDNGIFVDGRVNTAAGATLTQSDNGDTLGFWYTPEGGTDPTNSSTNVGLADPSSPDQLNPFASAVFGTIENSILGPPSYRACTTQVARGFNNNWFIQNFSLGSLSRNPTPFLKTSAAALATKGGASALAYGGGGALQSAGAELMTTLPQTEPEYLIGRAMFTSGGAIKGLTLTGVKVLGTAGTIATAGATAADFGYSQYASYQCRGYL